MTTYRKPKVKGKKIRLNLFLNLPGILENDLLFSKDGYSNTGYLAYNQKPRSCFLIGTKISLAGGRIEEIQNVRSGDKVLSLNLKNQKVIQNEVDQLKIHPYTKGGYLVVNGTLRVTLNHPIWVDNNRWIKAADLKIGDRLFTPENKYISVSSIKLIHGENTVYHLKILNDHHNYFAEDILVIS